MPFVCCKAGEEFLNVYKPYWTPLTICIAGKAERQSSKLEKELQDIKAQLNKANKEADSSKKEMKRSKGFTFY